MAERTCDLHMHSTASDGADPPEVLPRLAAEAGLSAIALTDHDTTAGLAACETVATEHGIAFAAGIELSADPGSIESRPDRRAYPHRPAQNTPGPDHDPAGAWGQSSENAPHDPAAAALHILGYFIRPDAPNLAQLQQRLRQARARRNPALVGRLRDLGVAITHQQVLDLAEAEQSEAPGRPHIARLLMQKGYVKSMHEAFSRYIGSQGAAYVPKDRLAAVEAIEAIHHAGGLACLAHPVQLDLDAEALEHAVARLADLGLDAIETRHSDHRADDVSRFERLAGRFRLLATGGSDYHGSRKRIAMGSQRVPMAVYEQLHEAWSRVASDSGV